MTLPIQLANAFRFSVIVFILSAFSNLPLDAQNQYWQHAINNPGTIGNSSRGQLFLDDNGITVSTGRLQKSLSGLGRLLLDKTTIGSSVVHNMAYIETRGDWLLSVYHHGLSGDIEFRGYQLDGSGIIFETDYGANLDNSFYVPPVVVKGEDNDYFYFDDTYCYKINIADGGTHSLIYKVAHGSNAIMDACYANGTLYACDQAGQVMLFNATGADGVWTFSDYQLFGIQPDGNAFVLTGEKNDKAHLLNISQDGQVNWSYEYDHARGNEVISNKDGGYLLTGTNQDETGFVIKTDGAGAPLWTSNALNHPGVQIIETAGGAVYALGKELAQSGGHELIKLGPNGEEGPNIGDISSYPLNTNNITANISPSGQLFFDGNDGDYHFPKDAATATFFAANLWMAGEDSAGDIHLSGASYFTDNHLSMGPIDQDHTFFSRIWSISQAEIDRVQEDLIDGQKDLDWPLDYLQWPANGNTLNNEAGASLELTETYAPFVDINNDGIYNPYDGDYPAIKGDQMLWWIFNTETSEVGLPVGAEVKASFYSSGCNSDHISYNTSYLEFDIENKSSVDYPAFSLALWADPDLGCYTDDYIGSIPSHNASFIYNEDALDGQVGNDCPSGVASFDEVPVQSVVFLNKTMDNFVYFQNPSLGNPEPGTLDPSSALEYHNYMNGLWRDGTPITSGGNGYNPASTDVVAHCFPGEPSDPNAWSLCSANLGLSDRRIIMSTHFENFGPGDKIELDMAFITSTGVELPCPNFDIIKEDIETIQSVYDNNGTDNHLDLGPAVQSLAAGETLTLDAGAGAASYEWSTGAVSQSIDVVSLGTYSVTVTDWYGCEKIDEVVVQFPSATINQAAEQSISLYPNPTNDQFSVLTNEPMLSLKVFSVSGQLLKHYNQEGKLGSNDFSTEGLTPGLYLVNVTLADGVYVGKLMVR